MGWSRSPLVRRYLSSLGYETHIGYFWRTGYGTPLPQRIRTVPLAGPPIALGGRPHGSLRELPPLRSEDRGIPHSLRPRTSWPATSARSARAWRPRCSGRGRAHLRARPILPGRRRQAHCAATPCPPGSHGEARAHGRALYSRGRGHTPHGRVVRRPRCKWLRASFRSNDLGLDLPHPSDVHRGPRQTVEKSLLPVCRGGDPPS